MLSIGQLADYVGVTRRAIRHYHALGLLAEPPRNSSGYRSYDAQAIVDLHRIKVFTDAGVPLARVRELSEAEPESMRAAAGRLDADLKREIARLSKTRRSLAVLAREPEPFVPAVIAEMHDRMRKQGVTERTINLERDAWMLIQVLFPDLVPQWAQSQAAMMDDAGYRDLYLLTDQAFDWSPDDPRIEHVAQRTVEWITGRPAPENNTEWGNDSVAYELVTTFRRDASPGWAALMERVEELIHSQERALPESQPHPKDGTG